MLECYCYQNQTYNAIMHGFVCIQMAGPAFPESSAASIFSVYITQIEMGYDIEFAAQTASRQSHVFETKALPHWILGRLSRPL